MWDFITGAVGIIIGILFLIGLLAVFYELYKAKFPSSQTNVTVNFTPGDKKDTDIKA